MQNNCVRDPLLGRRRGAGQEVALLVQRVAKPERVPLQSSPVRTKRIHRHAERERFSVFMAEQWENPRDHFIENVRGQFADGRGAAGAPVEGANLIGEDNALDGKAGRQRALEWVAFCPAGNGTAKREAGFRVVGCGADG